MATPTQTTGDRLRPSLLTVQDALTIEVSGRTDAAVLVPLYDRTASCTRCSPSAATTCVATRARSRFREGAATRATVTCWLHRCARPRRRSGCRSTPSTVLGALQPTPTIATGYAVYPFVGMIDPGREWTPSAHEVAQVIELPLSSLLRRVRTPSPRAPGLAIRTDTYLVGEHLIWGATARILADLLDRIGSLLGRRLRIADRPPSTADVDRPPSTRTANRGRRTADRPPRRGAPDAIRADQSPRSPTAS